MEISESIEKLKLQYNSKIITLEQFIDKEIELLLHEGKVEDIYNKYYSKIPFSDYLKVIAADPTAPVKNDEVQKPGRYSKWLLDLYYKNKLRLEDLYKATDYLTVFHKHKDKLNIGDRDINSYDSIVDLFHKIEVLQDAKSQSEISDEIKAQADKVYEDGEWLVVVPKTKEASCYYGKGTQWCTAASDNDYQHNRFEDYNRQGPLYINIHKPTQDKFQFSFAHSEFMDVNDEPVELSEFFKMNKDLLDFYWKREIKGNAAHIYHSELDGDSAFILLSDYGDFIEECDFVEPEDYNIESLVSILRGDGWDVFETYYQVDWDNFYYFTINKENFAIIQKIARHLISKGEVENPEDVNLEDDDELVEWAYRNIEEIKENFDWAYRDCQVSADESEAFNDLLRQAYAHFDVQTAIPPQWVEKQIKTLNGLKNVQRLKLSIPMETYKVGVICAMGDEGRNSLLNGIHIANNGSDEQWKIDIPYHGWNGTITDEDLNERLSEKLGELEHELIPPQQTAAAE